MHVDGIVLPFLAAIAPTPIQCYDWDHTFGSAFDALLCGVILLCLGLLTWFVRRPWGWRTARPYVRILISTIPFVLTILAPVSPFALRRWPGLFSFLQISPEYLDCAGVGFEARGFVGGLLGAGISVISQHILMAVISLVALALYIVVLALLTRVLAKPGWPRGLKRLL